MSLTCVFYGLYLIHGYDIRYYKKPNNGVQLNSLWLYLILMETNGK